jgi:hypothetical protein
MLSHGIRDPSHSGGQPQTSRSIMRNDRPESGQTTHDSSITWVLLEAIARRLHLRLIRNLLRLVETLGAGVVVVRLVESALARRIETHCTERVRQLVCRQEGQERARTAQRA